MRFSDEPLARRLEELGDRFMLDWLEGTGAQLARFGAATATVDPSRPELDFVNRVYGLWPEDADQIDGIAGFYRERSVRAWIELAPSMRFEPLAATLAEAGAAQIGFHTMLAGPAVATTSADVHVEPVDDPELFADVLLRGHGVPEGARTRDRASVARWKDQQGWRLYLARVDGEPAGAALLTLDDDFAYLANASTLPEFRNRGVQTALIGARIADAAALGAHSVSSQAGFGSASQRNLERAGLRVAYTKAVWRFQNQG